MPKTNPYLCFAQEYAKKHNLNLKEAIDACSNEWATLSIREREPYKQRASERYDSSEINLKKKNGKTENQEPQKQECIINSDTFEKQVSAVETSIAQIQNEFLNKEIKEKSFNFMHIQTFCKTNEDDDEEQYYVLAEIGIVRYSLSKGIEETLHTFIKPEKIPIGYRSTCMSNSKEYHQIPLDDFEEAIDDYGKIYDDIEGFLKRENKFNGEVYCFDSDIPCIRWSLDWLKSKKGLRTPSEIQVKSLQALLCAMATKSQIELTYMSATDLLKSTYYDYSYDTRCEYHENICSIYCSLGYVKRYSFIISEYFCNLFKIPTILGKHVPKDRGINCVLNVSTYDRTKSVNRHNTGNYGYLSGSSNDIRYRDDGDESIQSGSTLILSRSRLASSLSGSTSTLTQHNQYSNDVYVNANLENSSVTSSSSCLWYKKQLDSKSNTDLYNEDNESISSNNPSDGYYHISSSNRSISSSSSLSKGLGRGTIKRC